jgi:hypothetical protein
MWGLLCRLQQPRDFRNGYGEGRSRSHIQRPGDFHNGLDSGSPRGGAIQQAAPPRLHGYLHFLQQRSSQETSSLEAHQLPGHRFQVGQLFGRTDGDLPAPLARTVPRREPSTATVAPGSLLAAGLALVFRAQGAQETGEQHAQQHTDE